MDKTTRWVDNNFKNINEAIEQICDNTKFSKKEFINWKECNFQKVFEKNKKA